MKIDLFTPSQLQYPGAPGGACTSGSSTIVAGAFQAPSRDGLFNSIFTPDDLPYPLPVVERDSCQTSSGSGTTTPPPTSGSTPVSSVPTSGSGATAAAPTTPTAPSNVPSQIVINVGVPQSSAPTATAAATTGSGVASSSTSTAANATQAAASPAPVQPTVASAPAATSAAPAPAAAAVAPTANAISAAPTPAVIVGRPASPSDTTVKLYGYNPRLRARVPRAQDQLLEEYLEEQMATRMLTSHGSPIGFVVPDGHNAVEFYFGAVEVNPEIGCADDLDLIVTLGDIKLNPDAPRCNGSLEPGDSIMVTTSWRYASWVELAQEHLRVPIFARFYTTESA